MSSASTPTSAPPTPMYSLLGLRNYRLLWSAGTISLVGDSFQLVAFSVLVLDLTQSSATWGTIVMLQAIPSALLMLVGGVVTDRFRSRSVLLVSQLLQGALVGTVATLIVADAVALWHLYLFALAFGVVHAFTIPAQAAILPELIPPAQVRSANALTQTTGNLARALVPPLAGGVVAVAGSGLAFAVNAVSFVVSAATLRLLPATPREHPSSDTALQQLRAGLLAAREDSVVWLTIVLSTVFFFGHAGAMIGGLPALAKLTLRAGDQGVGILYGAAGFGALLGALLAGTVATIRRPGIVAYALTVVAGSAVAAAGLAPSVPAAVPLLALSGVAYSVSGIIFVSLVQTRTPAEVRGRVMSVLALGMVGLTPLSYGAVSLVGDLLTARGIMAFGGAFMILSGAIGLSRQAIRDVD